MHHRPSDLGRTTVVPGITVWNERWYTPDGSPERSSLMTVDLTQRRISANVFSAYRVTNGPYMAVRTMIAASGAVAGINGDFFDLGTTTGQTVGGIVRSGALWRTPQPGFDANFYIRSDGSAGMGPVTVTGSVHSGRFTHGLVSVNKVSDAQDGRLTLVTHTMDGTAVPGGCTVATGTLTRGTVQGGATFAVSRIVARTSGQAYLGQLATNGLALVGCGSSATWLRTALRAGRTATLQVGFGSLHLSALVSGAQILVQNGKGYSDTHGRTITDSHAETFACVSRDARHLLVGTIDMYYFDEFGVTMGQLRSYLLGKGCWSAMAFDGGGSSTLDYRDPSTSQIITVNHPADGQERLVPDALLFSYSS